MARLSLTDAEQRIKSLNGWTLQGDAIRKQYTFRDFLEAIKFVNCLAPKAEAADHHPDIVINYKRVTLTYSTHSEGGLTAKDFLGAAIPINAPEAHLQFARGRGDDRADSAAAAGVDAGAPLSP
jgi:4a-hydroxytetrahydrobiopterin dehydratase